MKDLHVRHDEIAQAISQAQMQANYWTARVQQLQGQLQLVSELIAEEEAEKEAEKVEEPSTAEPVPESAVPEGGGKPEDGEPSV